MRILLVAALLISNAASGYVATKMKKGRRSANDPCPTNYIQVPALAGYTTMPFCVAKYEMKNVSGVATSQITNTPWINISRGTDQATSGGAWKACKDLGSQYDLISNAQWQTIARNIADTNSNWSGGTSYGANELNRGHFDNAPANSLAAAEDTNSCSGTGQSCSLTSWNVERRTHALSNGVVIWDFAGNVREWVRDNNTASQGTSQYASQSTSGDSGQINYGNDEVCTSSNGFPYCGMGYGILDFSNGAVARGGYWSEGVSTGIFTAALNVSPMFSDTNIGFRCVYELLPSPGPINLGITPNSFSQSPTISYPSITVPSGYVVTGYQIRIFRSSDGVIVQDWINHTSGTAISGLSLADGIQYSVVARTVTSGGDFSNGSSAATWTATNEPCPANYILVPAQAGYTTMPFCVAKYEMKNISGVATSQSGGVPWVSIPRGATQNSPATAWKACADPGPQYNLISNIQWQTIARNIADVPTNWSAGAAYNSELNRGHSDSVPNNSLASALDSDPCNGTGQACNLSSWSSQKRTHVLSNGKIIWDFSGNVWEFLKDTNNQAQGPDQYVSLSSSGDARQTKFGNDQFCSAPASSPYCGMGYGYTNFSAGTIFRGGSFNTDVAAGVFASSLNFGPADAASNVGFRCAFELLPSPSPIVLGPTPSSASSSPTISYSGITVPPGYVVSGYQVKIFRSSDGVLVQDWVDHSSGAAVTGLSLANGIQYSAVVRTVSTAGDLSNGSEVMTWVAMTTADCTAPGQMCAGGAIFLGTIGANKYMTTPGGCSDIPAGLIAGGTGASSYASSDFTPTCSGADVLVKFWNNGTTNFYNIPALANFNGTGSDPNFGSVNTTNIVAVTAVGQGGFHAAARYCERLSLNGFTDWHLPNFQELNLMNINKGVLPGLDLTGNYYWSSTENDDFAAWFQRFSDGFQINNLFKNNAHKVRCVRRF